MESLGIARKIGGSLVVTIPKQVIEQESIREGERIKLNIEKVKVSGFGILKGVGPFTHEDRLKGQFEE